MRRRSALLLSAALAVVLVGTVLVLGLRWTDEPAQANPGQRPVLEVDVRPPTRQPQLPAAATEPTEAGATAFALFWFDTLNYSLANLDGDALASHTGAGCQQCSGWLIGISRWAGAGAEVDGGLTVPLDVAVGPFSVTEPVSFAATFLTTPATVTEPRLSPVGYPGGRTRGGFTLLWANERWQMTEVVIDARQPPAGMR